MRKIVFFFSIFLNTVCFAQNTAIMGDMNQDGKITIEDISLLVNDISTGKNLKYKSDCMLTYDGQVLASSIVLDKTYMTLKLKSKEKLTATIMPEEVPNTLCTWSSSNNNIATVSDDGTVTGVKTGSATISCTANDGSGFSAECAVTVTADPNLIPAKFSVSAMKLVQFAKSNLYYDGNSYKLEQDQTDYPTKYNAEHVDLFTWISLSDYNLGTDYAPYAASYSYTEQNLTDKFWCCEENPLTVDGTDGLYALTSDEWKYLFEIRRNANKLFKYGVTVGSAKYCLIIAPDDFSGTLQSSYTLDEVNSLHLVCLPACGYRSSTSTHGKGTYGQYWTATPYSIVTKAYYLYFNASDLTLDKRDVRSYGKGLRLVHNL